MVRTNMAGLATEALVEKYAAAAAKHGEAIEAGNPRVANRNADTIAAIYRELRKRGLEAQRQLLPLLTRPEPGIRGWAGAHALEFSPPEGERILTELASVKASLVGFSAEMTLKQWRLGRLRFD